MANEAEVWPDDPVDAPDEQWPDDPLDKGAPNTDSPFPQPVMDKANQFAMSPAEFDMAKYGSGMEDVAKAFGKSFYEAWGPERLGLSDESTAWLNKHGIFTHFEDEKTNPFSAFGALFGAAASVLDGANRTMQAGYRGAQTAGVEMGLPKDVVSIPDAFMGSPHPTGIPKPYVRPTKIEPVKVASGPERYVITDPLSAKADGETMNVEVLRKKDGSIEALMTDHGIAKVGPAWQNVSAEEAIAQTFGDHPQGAAPDLSKVRRDEGASTDTPAPIAKPRAELAQTGIPHVDAILNSEPIKSVINDPVIDRSHTVPNSWSGSNPTENPTTYISKDFPKEIEVEGIKYDPAEPAAARENAEEAAYKALIEGGMAPDAAQRVAFHDVGNPVENAWYGSHGIDPDKANAKMQPYIDLIAEGRTVLNAEFIKRIGSGDTDIPSTEQLSDAIKTINEEDQKHLGLDEKTFKRLQQLNREIDRGSDEAMREKEELLKRASTDAELDLPDADTLKQLKSEYESLERSDETKAEYEDGLARVLKRHISDFIDGNDFARAVFRKAFEEAGKHGIDTKALGNEVIKRYASDLSSSDAEFMRGEFSKFTTKKLPDVPPDMFRGMYPDDDPAKTGPGPIEKPTEEESAQARGILERKFMNGRAATVQDVLNTARDLDVIGPPKPEPTFGGSPSEQAEKAWPTSLSSAATEEPLAPRGHALGEYDQRGKEWVAKIDEPDDVRSAIEGIASDHDWFPEARGGKASPAARRAVAEAAGMDPADLNEGYFSEHFDSDGKVRSVIQVLRQTAKDVAEAAEKNVKEPSVENAATLAEAELRHTHVLEYTMGLRAESGRTLAAWKDLLRETEHTKATTEIRKKEVAGDTPKGTADVVDAVKDVQDNLKNVAKGEAKPGKKLGIQNLIDQAKKLAEGEMAPKEPGAERAPVSPEIKELTDAAKKVVDRFGMGDKTALDSMVDQAEREAVNMTKSKAVKDPVEALPPELQALVDKTKRVVDRFGGTARPERAALLLARTGKTAAEQEQLARSVAGLTPNQVAKVLNKVSTSKLAERPSWYYWLWQQGLISGLITHSKYLVVNTGQIITERFISPMVAAGIGKLRGENASLMAPVYGNMAMIHQVPDALAAAGEAFRTGQRVPLASEMRLFERGEESPQAKGAVNPYDVRSQGPDWGVWKRVFNEDQLDSAARVLGIPGRSANMIHTFFKVLSERAAAATQAAETAHSEGVTGDRFQQRYQYHLDNPTDDALRTSVNEAYSGAFMEKLEGGWAKASSAMNNFPIVGKWLFPFRHIPINIVRKGVEYSPAAILDSQFRSALSGEKGAAAQNLALAKIAVGTSLIGYFLHKGMADEATSSYPTDPKERLQWQLTGKQPMSVRMGDQWVSIDRLGPMGIVANMGSALGSIVRHYDGQDDDALSKAFVASAMAAVNILGNEAGFQSLRNAIDAMNGDEKKIEKFLSGQAASVVPTLISQPASAIDPYQRKADDLISALKYRVPWLRESLPVKRDPLYGEPLPNPGYHALFRSSQISNDPVRADLDRLKIYPTQPQNNIGGVKLPPDLYDKYQQLHGEFTKQLLGPVVNSPGWLNVPPFARAEAIQALRKSATESAKAQMQGMHQQIITQGMKDTVSNITGAKKTKLQDAR